MKKLANGSGILPPPAEPDFVDNSTQCNIDLGEHEMTRSDSVKKICQGFEDAKTTANEAMKELCEEDLKSQAVKWEDDTK